jgi:hypothetical protein
MRGKQRVFCLALLIALSSVALAVDDAGSDGLAELQKHQANRPGQFGPPYMYKRDDGKPYDTQNEVIDTGN